MRLSRTISSLAFVFTFVFVSSCAKNADIELIPSSGLGPAPTPFPAASLEAAQWIPNVPGVSTGNAKGTITTETTVVQATAPLLRLDDPWSPSKEVSVNLGTFDQSDFGEAGSITLTAQAKNYPIPGGAYPVLISLTVDTGSEVLEFVNTTRDGTANDCRASGMFACSDSYCEANPACTVKSPSSFANRADWEQHQVTSFDYLSVNHFPRCDNSSVWNSTQCPDQVSGPLPSGTYVAKYVLLSDQAADVSAYSATLKVTMTRKKDTAARDSAATNGALRLNVILVGASNIQASQTAKGAQNLNLLFEEVQKILSDSTDVQISEINAYEWDSDEFQDVDFTAIGDLFGQGSLGVAAEHQTGAINVFLVSSIPYSNSGFTILGIAGAIGGPQIAGTGSSGLAFSSMDELDIFNPACDGISACARDDQEAAFVEMGATIAHELGHYLGLNHPSERSSSLATQKHDALSDTPQCKMRSSGGSVTLDARACTLDTENTFNGQTCDQACPSYFVGGVVTNFCPAVQACQFNHIMWYTTKNRKIASGSWVEDGSMISNQSKYYILWSPLVQ